LLVGAALSLVLPTAASAQPERRAIDVIQVEGLIDPPVASLVRDAITDANTEGSTMVVLQLDSHGAVDSDVEPLLRLIGRSRVPIVVWVGPSGAEARGAATLLAEAAHVLFVAPSSSIGPGQPVRLDEPDATTARGVRARLGELAARRGRDPQGAAALASGSLSPEAARRAGAIDGVRPTVGEVIVTLDGKTVETAAGPVELDTAKVVGKGQDRRRQPNQDIVFDGLGLGASVQHGLISPSLAYFLFVAGLSLVVFEFFAASVGFASVVGGMSIIGAMYGFSHLPVRWWAAAILAFAIFGLTIDVQAGRLGPWTVIGSVALVAGSLTLYGGSSELDPAWWIVLLVCAGTVLFFVAALPSFVRARFSTPTVGREGMIGEMGTAEVAVSPDGVVLIGGARWRARTNRATPIAAGAPVRVIAVEGLVLEVEPEEGGARDYRERGRKRRKRSAPADAPTAD
jgi:membrane-bound serine protease (ClpP class)